MNKKILIACGGVIVLIGGAWLYASHIATNKAKDQIEGFLIRQRLDDRIAYGSVSASPFGTATISDVKLKLSRAVTVTIPSVDVSDVSLSDDGSLRGVALTINNATIPLIEIARESASDESLRKAVGIGYGTLHATTALAFRYDSDKRSLTYQTKGTIADAGNWDVNVTLGGIPPSLFNTIANHPNGLGDAMKGPQSLLGILFTLGQSLGQTTLTAARFSVDTAPLMKRLKQVPGTDLPPADSDQVINGDPQVDETQLVRAGMTPSQARLEAAAFKTFASQGGRLKVEARLDRPLPLFREDDLSKPSFGNLPEFLVATHSDVSN